MPKLLSILQKQTSKSWFEIESTLSFMILWFLREKQVFAFGHLRHSLVIIWIIAKQWSNGLQLHLKSFPSHFCSSLWLLFIIVYSLSLIYYKGKSSFTMKKKNGLTLDDKTCLACHSDHCCSSSWSFCLLALENVQAQVKISINGTKLHDWDTLNFNTKKNNKYSSIFSRKAHKMSQCGFE